MSAGLGCLISSCSPQLFIGNRDSSTMQCKKETGFPGPCLRGKIIKFIHGNKLIEVRLVQVSESFVFDLLLCSMEFGHSQRSLTG